MQSLALQRFATMRRDLCDRSKVELNSTLKATTATMCECEIENTRATNCFGRRPKRMQCSSALIVVIVANICIGGVGERILATNWLISKRNPWMVMALLANQNLTPYAS